MKSNKKKIYEYLLSNHHVTRIELAEYLGISKPATTKLVNNLIDSGYIYENQALTNNQVGRNKVELKINKQKNYLVGIMISNTETNVVITNIGQEIIIQKNFEYSALTKDILIEICAWANTAQKQFDNVLGVGVTFPGIVEEDQCMNLKVVDCDNPCVLIRESFDIKVLFSNNVVAIAKYINIFLKQEDFFIVKYGPGIGGNFMINNSVYMGRHHLSGEFGHINWLQGDGVYCEICEDNVCLESKVGYKNLYYQLTGNLKNNVHTEDIILAIDETNVHILVENFQKIGFAISTLARSIDLSSIILTGGLFQVEKYFKIMKNILIDDYMLGEYYNIKNIAEYEKVKMIASTVLVLNEIAL